MEQKNDVIDIMGIRFVLRTPFFLSIDEEGTVEGITLEHLFENNPRPFMTMRLLLPTLREQAQDCANRAQNRGVPLTEFKVRVEQEAFQDNWLFEFTLVFDNGEEVLEEDDDAGPEIVP